MLTHISIKDLVIVKQLELEFHAGMHAMTGETGAGKSILIEALGLALGDKADAKLIRQGADKAEVSAIFDISNCSKAQQWLEENDLADDGQLVLRRVLVKEGRSRAYINGSPAPQASLQTLANMIIAIHGQHAHQGLLRKSHQRALLDAYANHPQLLEETAKSFDHWQRAQQSLDSLKSNLAEGAARLDYLNFQVSELEPIQEIAKSFDQIEQTHKRLSHAESLLAQTQSITQQLDNDEIDISRLLTRLSQQVSSLAEIDASLKDTASLLESASIQVDEASQSLNHYADSIELDPEQLSQLDQQIAQCHNASRKHHIEIDQLPELFNTLSVELEQLQHADSNIDKQETQVKQALDTYLAASDKLHKSRQKAAKKLSQEVTQSMHTLGMEQGQFTVELSAQDHHSKHGDDLIQFMVQTNAGQVASALDETASGGELSRISLAIQVATASCTELPTLIFDEVDVGIGGAVAEVVGKLLRELGKTRQVLCVTHLAQVAAQSNHHYLVKKTSKSSSTETHITALDNETRTQEIARMMGGVEITESTLNHAAEMIQRASA